MNINKENVNNEIPLIIEGILINRKAKIKYKNINEQDIEKTIKIKNEAFIETFYPLDSNGNLLYKYFCISLPDDDDNDGDLIYSIKLYKKNDIKFNSLENNIYGAFYSKIIPVNSFLYFKMDNNLMNYIMISDSGYPIMYYYTCETYPKCNPKIENLELLSNKTHKINNIYSYKLKSELGNDKINKKQDIVFIYCPAYTFFTNKECQFKYIIYDNKDIITIKENDSFSKYLYKDEINNFKINNLNDKDISKFIIDINIFNGNIISSIIENDIKYSIKNLPNKISYIINFQENNNLKNINIQIKAINNSYFDIGYRTIKSNNENHLYLKSNFQYLLTLKENKNIIYFENKDQRRGNAYVVNFYNLNCKLNISKLYTKNKDELILNDNFAQETFTIYDGTYYSEYFNYELKIISSSDTDKSCFLYVSGYEAPKYNSHFLRKEILINENIPHRIKFGEKLKNVTYLYNHIALDQNDKSIIIQFNQINAANYVIRFYFDDNILPKNLSDYTFENPYNFELSTSKQFYFNKTHWNNLCTRNICNVKIEIEFVFSSNDEETILETLIRREQSIPTFIEKNRFISDFFTKSNWLYYYTDIGKGDYGNIRINYYKSSGEIYGKIIKKKDIKSWTEDIFPKIEFLKKEGSLNYIKINEEDTKDCNNNGDDGGCYLLISMRSNIKGIVVDMLQIFYFNLGIIIHNNNNNKNPEVSLPLNELIMGNILSSLDYDNYNVIIPSNSYELFIDFQTYENNECIILINIGKSHPNKNNYHFIFKSIEENSIFKLNMDEIINKAKEYNINLPNNNKGYYNIELSISIYFNKINYMNTGIYIIKFHISKNNELDYYITKSNQKALCQPKILSKNKYQCLYSIYLLVNDILSPMLLYANLKNKNDKAKIYAFYFSKNLIETWDKQLVNDIPTFFNGMHNEFNKNNYLYVKTLGNNEHLLVNVNINKNETIEFFSALYNITYVAPSPSMTQLYVVNSELEIEFPLNSNLIIEIIPVNGKGYLFWKENPDNIFELNNKIILYHGKEQKNSNIIIKNKNQNELIFYLKYTIKTFNENIISQEMNIETSFNYDKINLPIYLYLKLPSFDKDINIITKFENLDIDFSEFKISGSISKLDNLNNPQIILDNEINCEYDSILRTSSIYIPKDKIESYNINDNPILLLSLSNNKLKEYSNIKYIKFNSYISQQEIEINPNNKKYYYGKLNNNNSIYKIKIDFINRRYIKIVFSSNNDNLLDWSINRKENSKVNDTFKEMKSEIKNGITTLTFKSSKNYFLYLNIFTNGNTNNLDLSYSFKVSDSPKNDFIKYSIVNDDKIKLVKTSNNSNYNYRIILNEISEIKENVDITYFVKLLNRTSNKEELKDGIYLSNLNNIFEMKNKKSENGKIRLDIYNISDKEYNYVKVIALIDDKNRNNYEYISYKGRNLDIDINKGDKINPSGGSSNSTKIIIIIVVIVFILVIGGIVGYFTYKYIKSGQNLLNKVNSISFQDEKNSNLLISPLNSNEDDFILD